MLTIVIGMDGRIYNISNDEHPTIAWGNEKHAIVKASSIPKNAYCVSEEDYVKMMERRGQRIESSGKTLAEIEALRKEVESK